MEQNRQNNLQYIHTIIENIFVIIMNAIEIVFTVFHYLY